MSCNLFSFPSSLRSETLQPHNPTRFTFFFLALEQEYNQHSTLFFCEFCLNFFGLESELQRHMKRCTIRHPPGNEIYRSEETNVTISVYEVDGQKEVVYCQNICYIAKLFLDHKTLEYDCTPFIFYVLCESSSRGCHMVGYFSKEKKSSAGYNLACILTMPCHQRKGEGRQHVCLRAIALLRPLHSYSEMPQLIPSIHFAL